VLPKEYGGEGELLPLADACRRFKLPPWDRMTEAEVAAASEAAADAALVVSDEGVPAKAGATAGAAPVNVAARAAA
jgi:hypothetical protein